MGETGQPLSGGIGWPRNQTGMTFNADGSFTIDRGPLKPSVTLSAAQYQQWLGNWARFYALIDPKAPPSVYSNPGTGVSPDGSGQPIAVTGNTGSTGNPDIDTKRTAIGQIPGTSVTFKSPG